MSAVVQKQGHQPEFEILNVSIGLGNIDHANRKSFGQGEIHVGPFKVMGFVLPEGTVSLPSSIQDEGLRVRLSIALRGMVQGQIAARWERHDHADVAKILPPDKQSADDCRLAVAEIWEEVAWV